MSQDSKSGSNQSPIKDGHWAGSDRPSPEPAQPKAGPNRETNRLKTGQFVAKRNRPDPIGKPDLELHMNLTPSGSIKIVLGCKALIAGQFYIYLPNPAKRTLFFLMLFR